MPSLTNGPDAQAIDDQHWKLARETPEMRRSVFE